MAGREIATALIPKSHSALIKRMVLENPGAATKRPETTKPSELLGFDGARWLLKLNLVTPTGVEPVLPP